MRPNRRGARGAPANLTYLPRRLRTVPCEHESGEPLYSTIRRSYATKAVGSAPVCRGLWGVRLTA